MADALKVDFTQALATLQSMLGESVCALVNVRDTVTGCVMEGELKRVATLPPDNAAVHIVIGDGQGVVLDPDDVQTLLAGGDPSERQAWIEFHLPGGVVIRLEQANSATHSSESMER